MIESVAPSAAYVDGSTSACTDACIASLARTLRHTAACSAQWNFVVDALVRSDDEPVQGPEEAPRDAAGTDRPTPRWARVGAVVVIVAAALVGTASVGSVAHTVLSAPATAVCDTDASCATYDWAHGATVAPVLAPSADGGTGYTCPVAGWAFSWTADGGVCAPESLGPLLAV